MAVLKRDLGAPNFGLVDGICMFGYDDKEYVLAWKNCYVYITPVSGRFISWRGFEVAGAVVTAFQILKNMYCVDCRGNMYVLRSAPVRDVDNEDIFESSDSSDEFDNLRIWSRFERMCVLRDIVRVKSLKNGFVTLRKVLGELFCDVYKIDTSGPLKTCSIWLCRLPENCADIYALNVYKLHNFTEEMCCALIKEVTLVEIHIIFIGVPTGDVFLVALDSTNAVVGRPELFFSASYSPIIEILCLRDSEADLYSLITVIYSRGFSVVIKYDPDLKVLMYKVGFLHSSPCIASKVGEEIVYGDGINLWKCKVNKEKVTFNSDLLSIKGAYLIDIFPFNKKFVVVTFHQKIYIVSLENQVLPVPSVTHSFVRQSSGMLCEYLEEIEKNSLRICFEEKLISSFSALLNLKTDNFRDPFYGKLSVCNIDSLPVENVLQGIKSYFTGGVNEQEILSDLYLIKIEIENKSDLEFSSLVWLANICVEADNATIQVTRRLSHSFTKYSSFSSSVYVRVKNPALGVILTVTLICELPCIENYMEKPWLSVPVVTKSVDLNHFFKATILSYDTDFSFCEKMKRMNQKRNPQKQALFSELKLPCDFSHSYIFRFSDRVYVSNIQIFILGLCHHTDPDKSDRNKLMTEFDMFVGTHKINFSISEKCLKISSSNVMLLQAFKVFIIRQWLLPHGPKFHIEFVGLAVPKGHQVKEKLMVGKQNPDSFEVGRVKASWRHFTFKFLPLL